MAKMTKKQKEAAARKRKATIARNKREAEKKKEAAARKRKRTMSTKSAPRKKSKGRRRTAAKRFIKDYGMEVLSAGLAGVVGSVAFGALASRIPTGGGTAGKVMKAALPAVGGILFAKFAPKQMVKRPGVLAALTGAVAVSGLSTVRLLAPNVPILAGDEERLVLEEDEAVALLGGIPVEAEMMGAPVDPDTLSGEPISVLSGYSSRR